MLNTMDAETLKKRKVGVLMGGLSAEREVSLKTGEAVAMALRGRGYRTVVLDVDRQICSRLVEARVQVAFIALHGRWGEDGCIQGLLEAVGIPYTGSGVLASGLAMDKVQAKRLFDWAGLPTAPWRFPVTPPAVQELGLPAVIKPRAEGSTVGLSVIRDPSEVDPAVQRAGGPEQAMLERYIEGREIAVAVLGRGEEARCLGSVEIRPANGLYDYEAKYHRDDTEYLAPAPVPPAVQDRLAELTLAVHRLLGCGGATRTDFIWNETDDPVVLELNTIPGMTSHSLLPMIAKLEGMSFEDLVETILLGAALKN